MKKITCLAIVCLLLCSCITVNCAFQLGERNTTKSDQDQTPSTKVDAKVPVSLTGK